jgi:hypothetical protein
MDRMRGTVMVLGVSCLILMMRCDLLYSPQQQPSPLQGIVSPDDPVVPPIGYGRIYSLTPGQQTCNASISQDTINYPACMLWLNATGADVKVPTELSDFLVHPGQFHDRLTIVDTSNTLRWFIYRWELNAAYHVTAPEWTTHPNYVLCIGADAEQDLLKHYGIAVRLSDKASLRLTHAILSINSYPHLYLPDTATSTTTVNDPVFDGNGIVSRTSIKSFFGTTNVKMVFGHTFNSVIASVDFNEAAPQLRTLNKPLGREDWTIWHTLISPDGNWVAFDCLPPGSEEIGPAYESYLQELKAGANPILVAQAACDPHWWVDPKDNAVYIIYAALKGSYYIEDDLADSTVMRDTLLGVTCRQKLTGSRFDHSLRVDPASPAKIIAPIPMKGGLSRNGRLLCSAFKYTYIYKLPQ